MIEEKKLILCLDIKNIGIRNKKTIGPAIDNQPPAGCLLISFLVDFADYAFKQGGRFCRYNRFFQQAAGAQIRPDKNAGIFDWPV